MKNLKDKLSPFKTTSKYHGNIVLNFNNPEKEFPYYADAFHEAGKILINDIKNRNGYNDLEACPIVFLYRHALELHFKSILIVGVDALFIKNKNIPIEKNEIYSTHSLLKLLPAVKFVIEEVGWSWDLGIKDFKEYDHFKEFVNIIDSIDPMSFAFRYPINKKGESPLPKHFVFNIIQFGEDMDKILELLSGASLGLIEMFDAAAEECYNNFDSF